MKKRLGIATLSALMAGMLFLRLPQIVHAQGQPTVQWQAVLNLINNIQAQLNAIKGQVLPLPTAGTAGYFPIVNAAGSAYGLFPLSGDVASSNTIPGKVTVQGIQTVAVANTPPTDGQSLIFKAASGKYQPGNPVPTQNVVNILDPTLATDEYSQMQTVEISSTKCPVTGCVIDGTLFSGDLTALHGVTITKPTHIIVGGNVTLASAESSFVFGDGSQGSVLECAVGPGGPTCGNESPCPATGNGAAIVASPASGTVDIITNNAANDGNQGGDITYKNCNIIGTTSHVRHGIFSKSGSTNNRYENLIFSFPGVTIATIGTGPSGRAIYQYGAVGDISSADRIQVYGWTRGIQFDASAGGGVGSTGPVTVTNSLFGWMGGTVVECDQCFDFRYENNGIFNSSMPASTPAVLATGAGTSWTPLIENSHWDGTNNAGNAGVCDLQIAGGFTKTGGAFYNSFNGNTNDSVAAHDPADAICIANSNVLNFGIAFNNIEGYANGIKSSAANDNGSLAVAQNLFAQGHAGTGGLWDGTANGALYRFQSSPVPPIYDVNALPITCRAGTAGYIVVLDNTANTQLSQGVSNGGTHYAMGWCDPSGAVRILGSDRGASTDLPYQALTSSGGNTSAIVASGNNDFSETLTENTTIPATTGQLDGEVLTFKFLNTAGNFTVSWDASYHFVGASAPTITVGAKISMVQFKLAGSTWYETWRSLNLTP